MNSNNTSGTRALLKGYAEVNTSQKLKKNLYSYEKSPFG